MTLCFNDMYSEGDFLREGMGKHRGGTVRLFRLRQPHTGIGASSSMSFRWRVFTDWPGGSRDPKIPNGGLSPTIDFSSMEDNPFEREKLRS
jgi:hypothetical protein